jgi:3-deoxy-manno-octulosonate cytidylyltransferase (CMP-KDO synthetase)
MKLSGLVVVVPARRESTRLPKKLFLSESGKPLLAHTLERCLRAKLPTAVIAAVDCPELAAIAEQAGAHAVLTAPELASGSDRVWAAIKEAADVTHVINVQGDEPELEPDAIDTLAQTLLDGDPVATLSAPLPPDALHDPAAVKVFSSEDGWALGFRRLFKEGEFPSPPQLHMGVYGYQREALAAFSSALPTEEEKIHRLEQLRLLSIGIAIKVLPRNQAFPGIDTRADYDGFLERLGSPSSSNS